MKTSNRAFGDRDEERIARKYGGRVVDGSGSSREKKGDIVFPLYLAQAKSSRRGSISVKDQALRDIEEQAFNRARRPLFFLSFYEGDQVATEWVAIPTWFAKELGIYLDEARTK